VTFPSFDAEKLKVALYHNTSETKPPSKPSKLTKPSGPLARILIHLPPFFATERTHGNIEQSACNSTAFEGRHRGV
jgi:hypothetical protein